MLLVNVNQMLPVWAVGSWDSPQKRSVNGMLYFVKFDIFYRKHNIVKIISRTERDLCSNRGNPLLEEVLRSRYPVQGLPLLMCLSYCTILEPWSLEAAGWQVRSASMIWLITVGHNEVFRGWVTAWSKGYKTFHLLSSHYVPGDWAQSNNIVLINQYLMK